MKITISKEYDVKDCESCPYYRTQRSYDGEWKECECPFCILDGHIERAKATRQGLPSVFEKYGLAELNRMFKHLNMSFCKETHFVVRRDGKVLDKKVMVSWEE